MPRLALLLAALLSALAFLAGCTALESREVHSTRESGIYYFLPRVRLRLEVSAARGEDGEVLHPRLTFKERIFEPDPEAFYRIDHRPSFFSSDEISVRLTPEGLLEEVAVVTDGKADELALRIVESAAQVAKALAFPAARVSRREVLYEATVDPTDEAEVEALNQDIARFGGLGVTFRRRFPRWLARPSGWGGDSSTKRVGVFFRPLLPYELLVTSAEGPTRRETVLLPNEAPLFSLDITRSAFVEKETRLEFEKGILRKVSVRKPSEALALAGVPLEIARTLASLPAEILRLRVDYSTSEAEVAEARRAWFEAQAAVREAEAISSGGGDPMR